MSSERLAFERALFEDPANPQRHWVYSDWLRDQGNEAEANFRKLTGDWVARGLDTEPADGLSTPSIGKAFAWHSDPVPVLARKSGGEELLGDDESFDLQEQLVICEIFVRDFNVPEWAPGVTFARRIQNRFYYRSYPELDRTLRSVFYFNQPPELD